MLVWMFQKRQQSNIDMTYSSMSVDTHSRSIVFDLHSLEKSSCREWKQLTHFIDLSNLEIEVEFSSTEKHSDPIRFKYIYCSVPGPTAIPSQWKSTFK